MELEIITMVLSCVVANIPDETLALITRSLYEPWDPSKKVKLQPEKQRLINKRFKIVVSSQPSLHSFLTTDMSHAQVSRRLDLIVIHVGMKIRLDESQSDFCKFIKLSRR